MLPISTTPPATVQASSFAQYDTPYVSRIAPRLIAGYALRRADPVLNKSPRN